MVVAAVVVVVAAVLGAVAVFAGGAPRRPATRASSAQGSFTVSVSGTPVTQPIAANYLGLAVEYKTIPAWVGPPGTGSIRRSCS